MALPYRTTGSLRPTFRTCSTCLSRSQARFCLYTLRPISDRSERTFVLLRYSLGDRPVKLPTIHCPRSGLRTRVRTSSMPGWYFKDGSTRTGVHASKPPTNLHKQAQSPVQSYSIGFTGSFRLAADTLHLHSDFNFTESRVETAPPSLRHSCRSELTRQEFSLP